MEKLSVPWWLNVCNCEMARQEWRLHLRAFGLEASAFGLRFVSPTAYGCRGIIRRLRDARCLLSMLLSASDSILKILATTFFAKSEGQWVSTMFLRFDELILQNI